MATGQDSGALSHIRVLELGGAIGASYAGHFLVDLGADVVKVEPPTGDPVRQDPPFVQGPRTLARTEDRQPLSSPSSSGRGKGQKEDSPHSFEGLRTGSNLPPQGGKGLEIGPAGGPGRGKDELDRSLLFIHLNANKRSIALDLGKAEDRQVVLDLAKTVDAVIEAFPAGYLAGIGLGYEQMKAANPGIVLTSITPFGQTGPFRNLKGNNGIAEAMGGVIFTLGDDTKSPVASPNDWVTQIAGIIGASHTLAAYYHHRQGGEGQQIDISLQDVGTQVQAGFSEYSLRRLLRRRPGTGSSAGATNIFATKDGYIFIQPSQPHMWGAMVEWMGDPVLAGPEWLEREYKNQNADVISMLFSNFIGGLTTAEFMEGAQGRGIPSAPVNTIPQFVDSEQVKALGSFTPKSHPVAREYRSVDFMRMSESPIRFRRPAPRLDEHREEILGEVGRAVRPSRASGRTDDTLNPSLPPEGGKGLEGGRVANPPLQEGTGKGQARPPSSPSPAAGEGIEGSGQTAKTVPAGGSNGHRRLPLEGIRVLDFTRVIAGPAGTQVLGFLGADVIKVESKGLGTGREPSGGYPEINRAKKSITLDSRSPEGKDLLFRLAAKSDVVINNFSAFVMDRLGLTYEAFAQHKKDIIYVRMPGFGREGPAKDWVAFGQMLQSFTGLVSMWKHPESPMLAGIKGPVGDYVSCTSAVLAVMAALEYRDRTGKGQILDLNMLEALAATLNPFYMDYIVNKHTPEPFGYRSTRYAPYGGYPCRGEDEWCVIAVETEEEWKAFQKAIGEPGWAFDPRFQSKAGRTEHREELDANISTWTKEYTRHQVMHFLQRDGVPAGSIQSAEDLYYDYHLRKRGHIVEVWNPAPWGTFDLYGTSARMSGTPVRDTAPTPDLGQHNEEVFKGLWGLPDAEYERLVKAKGIY